MWLFQYLKSIGNNFGQVDNKLYRGSKPSNLDEYKKLRSKGITAVINTIDEDQTEEARLAHSVMLDWHHLPMSDKEWPSPATIKQFFDIVKGFPDETFFLHCKGGRHRTSLLIAMYRVVVNGWTKKKAWKEAEKYGWYSALGHGPLKDYFWDVFNPDEYKGIEVH